MLKICFLVCILKIAESSSKIWKSLGDKGEQFVGKMIQSLFLRLSSICHKFSCEKCNSSKNKN